MTTIFIYKKTRAQFRRGGSGLEIGEAGRSRWLGQHEARRRGCFRGEVENRLEVDAHEFDPSFEIQDAAPDVDSSATHELDPTVVHRVAELEDQEPDLIVDDGQGFGAVFPNTLHEIGHEGHELVVGVPGRMTHQHGFLDVLQNPLDVHVHLYLNGRHCFGLSEQRLRKVLYGQLFVNLLAMPATILLCPKNDEESLQILKIAQAAGYPVVMSEQPHGARLYREPNLIARLKYADPDSRRVAIVEIPGPEVEAELRSIGYEVVIIDHHRYGDLDRMQHLSSLEQFLTVFELDDAKLIALGFDPVLVRGVGMIDRGFVWELKKEGLSKEDQKRVRDYYVDLMHELGSPSAEAVAEAKRAWATREQAGELLVVKSQRADVKIREALSFVIADEYETPPQVLILEANGRVSLQDSDLAPKFHKTFGGFTFGQDRCWGFAQEPGGRPAPSLEDMLRVSVE